MRALLQRVKEACVTVEGEIVGEIGKGLLVFLGVGEDDTEKDLEYLAEKVAYLRIFPDEAGKMNLNVGEAGGKILVVSQFTLYGDCRRGRRPSFSNAAKPDLANKYYEEFTETLEAKGISVEKGVFQADMDVSLVNDGPVTILLSSKGDF